MISRLSIQIGLPAFQLSRIARSTASVFATGLRLGTFTLNHREVDSTCPSGRPRAATAPCSDPLLERSWGSRRAEDQRTLGRKRGNESTIASII